MKADIIVPTYNQTDHTLRCFQSLRRHTSDYRLIWVDNGSTSDSREKVMDELARHAHGYPIWSDKNLGFVGGNNLALKMIFEVWDSPSRYTVMLNNDVVLTPNWLDKLTDILKASEDVYAVGPVTSECKSWQSYLNIPAAFPEFMVPDGFMTADLDERAEMLEEMYGDRIVRCRMLAFFCTVFKREVFERLGYLDELYGEGYGDDDDLCMRMKKANMKCALSCGSYVFHNHRTTFKSRFSDEEIKGLQKKQLENFKKKYGEEAAFV